MRLFGLYCLGVLALDDDVIELEHIHEYIADSEVIGARGLGNSVEKLDETLHQLAEFQDDLSSIARRREEQAVELGLTATFASESGFDSHVMVPEILRFYLNQYTFDMIPSKVKVGRMLQSGCWCQLLQYKDGRGTPLNQFDQFCKQWHQCKGCLGRECANAASVSYKVVTLQST